LLGASETADKKSGAKVKRAMGKDYFPPDSNSRAILIFQAKFKVGLRGAFTPA
jgi:hypothetical protein